MGRPGFPGNYERPAGKDLVNTLSNGDDMKKNIFVLILFLVSVTGCSHLSVRHLEKNPLLLDQTEHLSMRYWNFEYVNTVENGDYIISGVALPKTEVMPGGTLWLHDFWISAYLSDKNGKVLAKDLLVFPVQELDPVEGVKFQFNVSPDVLPMTRDTFITFGYRMSLTESRFHRPLREKPLTGDISVFFASEGALAR